MATLRLAMAGLLLAPLFPLAAAAQALDATFTPPTGLYTPGAVYALGPQQADGKRVVAGKFSRVNGAAISNLVRLDAAGAVDQAFSQAVGPASSVYSVRSLPSGQYLLGTYVGSVTAGGITRAALLRLNADGTADASFDPGSGPGTGSANNYSEVDEFAAQPDGKVVITGTFSTFGNVPAPGVARLNTDGRVDTGFNVGTGLNVNSPSYSIGSAVAVQADGKILVGGQFDTFNGQPANCLVRLTATGSIDPTFTAPPLTAFADGIVVQPDGKILVIGGLVTATSSTVEIFRLLPSGVLDPSFSPPADFAVDALGAEMVLQPDGKILAIGTFGQTAGSSHVTRFNADGSQDLSFQVNPPTHPTYSPYTIGLQANGSVLVGGSFDIFNGTESSLGRLSDTGAFDAAFAPKLQLPGTVAAVVRQPDGKYIIGGNFTEINGQAVHRLARLTAAGAFEAGYSGAAGLLPGPVSCLVLQPDGNVLAGTSGGVLRFLSSGVPDASFAQVYAIDASCLALQPDGKVLVGGPFSFTNGSTSYRALARFTATGALDPTFARNIPAGAAGTPNNTDAVLVQADGRIVVGGRFIPSRGAPICRVVRYETTGGLDPTFNNASNFSPNTGTSVATNSIYSIVQQPDGKLLAAGNFRAVGGSLRQGVARLSTTGQLDATFVPNGSLAGTVYNVALQPNGLVLLGGAFAYPGAANTYSNLARVLADGTEDPSFGPTTSPNGAVRSLLIDANGSIVIGGAFSSISGQPAVGVARIAAANVLAVAASAAVAARTSAWPVPAHGLLHVAPDASAHPLALSLCDALGRAVRTQPIAGAAEQTLTLDGLPAGVYLLRVSYTAGTVTRRIAVQ